MSGEDAARERMRQAFEVNAADLLAYLERRLDPRSQAADVLGDAMVTAWKRVANLPDDPERARMWLFVVVRNTLLNHRRGLGRYRAAVDRLRGFIVADVAASTADADRTETRLAVRAALLTLDATDAELVRLINWDGFSLAEVAELQGLPPTTVRSRYARALAQLSSILGPAREPDVATTGGRDAQASSRSDREADRAVR